ncbi:carboxypeptidase-like regulatory domain-containing protein [Solirubrobacter ginsenosidimutans]|uniref:Carboxypeptidase-like regulatory domain-containing protein n=1 Tax=Solirubrobacter ginsenosidimutans TaxID=490573 RepID=A0A9X3S3P3_9ACTN|nr:carboxypeptidase-like regulatory domain-containing protein [Solirubrobacter ginsenosidimutans]MDA0164834.1 carboxypeptidase-like regulatory domain-containing protein [Solirubrobacter ginsenosidimutans]
MLAGLMRKDAALLVATIVGLLALPAASARAGTYDVVACNTVGGDGGGINRAWTVEPYNRAGKSTPPASAFSIPPLERCSTPAGLTMGSAAVAPTNVRVDDGAAFVFHAPADATVKDVTFWRFTQSRATSAAVGAPYWVSVARAGTSAGGAVVLGGTSGPDYCSGATLIYPAYCGRGVNGFGTGSVSSTYTAVGQPVVSLGIECAAAATTATCPTANADGPHAGVQFQGAKVTVEDTVAPELALSSPLDGWRRPTDAFTATGTDASGIRLTRMILDGAERVSQAAECDYHLPAPCPTQSALAYDLTGVIDGRHALTTIVQDTAGNVTRADRTVDVDGTPPVIAEAPVSGRTITALLSDASSGVAGGTIEIRGKRDAPFLALPTTLRGGKLVATVPKSVKGSYGIRVSATDNAGNAIASLVTSMSLSTRIGSGHARKVQDARATVGYGRAVTVLGRLTSTDGAPVAGQPIVLNGIQHRAGATSSQVATATTDADGRFSVTLPAGPSQRLTVVYPGAAGMLTRTREVALRVPASATIRASKVRLSGAGSVRFSGRLRMLGTSLPPGGKIVDLQASQNGRWTTVDAVRASGRDGAWHAVAHFRGNAGRFPIRLRIRREALFPYELGYSASVVITVR